MRQFPFLSAFAAAVLGGPSDESLTAEGAEDSPWARRNRQRMQLSVVIITFNEQANIGRTLASVQPLVADGQGEIIVVDSGSTDRTLAIAKSYGAKIFIEEWKGYATQKNSAIDKAIGNWILSLDADEEVSPDLAAEIDQNLKYRPAIHKSVRRNSAGNFEPIYINGCWIPRK